MVKVRYDAGGGLGLQPLDVDDAVLLDIDGVGDISDTDCDQGTAADGTCTVTISSDDTGDSTVTASYHAVHATARNAFEDLTGAAVKHWVDYKVLVEPNAVNLVGDDHVFTVTVTRDDGSAAGFVPVANGNVQLAWSGGAGSGITAVSLAGTTPLNSCTTDEAGQCTVTVSSSTPLSGELTATYQTQLDSGTHSFSSNASKQWVNWTLSITPAQAENLVGTNHTFVVKVTHDAGAGGGLLPLAGAKPVINLAGLGTVTANTCTEGTNALGLCTVTITSAVPGTSTVSASFQAVLDQASISLQAQGSKLWVDYRLVVSPETAVNPINTTHILTVTLEKNIGNGFVPAPSQTVTLGLSGPGSITIVDAGTIGSALAGSCTTDAAGTCRVTITSPVAGLATLTATYDAKVGETSGSFTDSGNKLWEAPVIVAAVAPLQVLAAAEELPRTGAPIQSTLYGAMWLIGAGFVLCLIGRQRRRSNPSV
jgi:adhesin/invasin